MFKQNLMKVILAPAIFFVLVASTSAERATEEQMRLACRNWMQYMVHATGGWAGDFDPHIQDSYDIVVGDTLLGRCFSISPSGYVLVPAMMELPPIKASLQVNDFTPGSPGVEDLFRDALRSKAGILIKAYGSLDFVPQNKDEITVGGHNRDMWDAYLQDEKTFKTELTSDKYEPLEEFGPLLTTVWHQDDPYNLFCPTGVNGRCVVGCGATAISQILAYHRWPMEGTGSYSYYWWGDYSCEEYDPLPGCTLTADFSDAYDWDNILDIYYGSETIEQKYAVAELCYEAGVAHDMSYGSCASGAGTYQPVVFLPSFFRYKDQIVEVWELDYDSTVWFDMIKADINAGLPVFYNIPGHFIIGDGWRESGALKMIHMNYGWGGSHNMWFTLDNLYCPWEYCDDGYDGMLLGIEPDRDVYYTADGKWGQVPFSVQFTGAGELPGIDTWIWNFGDGEVSYEQSPLHEYTQGGLCDVTLEVHAGAQVRTYTATDYITSLADSLIGIDAASWPGSVVEVAIHVSNAIPLNGIRIPVEYGGTLNLTLQSYTTDGCRGSLFEYEDELHINPWGKQVTYSLYNVGDDWPALEPGSGPILKMYFSIPGSAEEGEVANIVFDGYSSYTPRFTGTAIVYSPILGEGEVTIGEPDFICGDANDDENVNLLDVLFLIDYLYGNPQGPTPSPPESGDVNNGDGKINLLDILWLISYLYGSPQGPAPSCP